jgi:hypothetical protein
MGIALHSITASVTWQPEAARWTSPDPPCTAVVVPLHEVTLHACLSVQLGIQGLDDTACSSAGVLILVLLHAMP